MSVHYHSYLELDTLLSVQKPITTAHEEMLFIITHQAYELWFKQISFELTSIIDLFDVKPLNINIILSRLDRVKVIYQTLIKQMEIIETMTPIDFLSFRDKLVPASGFQSFQFRTIENLLGLDAKQRQKYNDEDYKCPFSSCQYEELEKLENNKNLLSTTKSWLGKMPNINIQEFNFTKRIESIFNIDLSSQDDFFLKVLFIQFYKDVFYLNHAFRFLHSLVEIDDLLTTWRFRHSQMVSKVMGNKQGTGGSSGHDYLNKTVRNHSVFSIIKSTTTLLTPKKDLPKIPNTLKTELKDYFLKFEK